MRTIDRWFLALALVSSPIVARADSPGAAHGSRSDSLDDVLKQAANAGERPDEAKPGDANPTAEPKAPATVTASKVATTVPGPADARPAALVTSTAPGEPPPAATDDNDTSAEAAAPAPLAAVRPTREPRRRGPYEMGPLDCRVLDGAGIERLLPKRIVAGEEPDLLCRVLVTQPATVSTAPHTLTISVTVGDRETFRQARNVRISSVGRRSLVFVVPADKISSDDPAQVKVHAQLSAPAAPAPGRDVQFVVESED